MKKNLFSVMMMAVVATMSFVSCSDDTANMTDDELKAAIVKKINYSGTEDGDDVTLNMGSSGDYLLKYTDEDLNLNKTDSAYFSKGTWAVVNSVLSLTQTSPKAASFSGTIGDEGKSLTLTIGTLSFVFPKN